MQGDLRRSSSRARWCRLHERWLPQAWRLPRHFEDGFDKTTDSLSLTVRDGVMLPRRACEVTGTGARQGRVSPTANDQNLPLARY